MGASCWLSPSRVTATFPDSPSSSGSTSTPTTVQELTYECVSDIDSRFAQVITDTGDFNWYQLPGQLAQVGMAVYIACQQGLQLPPLAVADYTPQMWAELYAHRMAWTDCIEREAHIDWGPRV